MVRSCLHLRGGAFRALASLLLFVVATGLGAQGVSPTAKAPNGWFLAGSNPSNYRTGVDGAAMRAGLPSAYLRSIANGNGFGTLMQSIGAANYAGKRVRLRGWVKSENVDDWAGLWMRVDKGQELVAFDNMQDRAIRGAQTWSSYDVVLDVPGDATSIHFGVLLTGAGQVWLNNVSLEVVDGSTPITGARPRATLPLRPVNLTFSE